MPIAILVRGLERDARDLAPVLGTGEGGAASLQRQALAVPPRAVWLGAGAGSIQTIGVCGSCAGCGRRCILGALFITLREITLEVPMFAALGWGVGAAWRLSQLTERRARPDLLDPRSFAALARNGTRLAAVWLAILAIGVPVILVPPEGWNDAARTLLVMTLVLASLAVVALILPCRGAHRVLRSAKRSELAAVRCQIAEARRAREDTRLSGLLAWEARIQGVSEWRRSTRPRWAAARCSCCSPWSAGSPRPWSSGWSTRRSDRGSPATPRSPPGPVPSDSMRPER